MASLPLSAPLRSPVPYSRATTPVMIGSALPQARLSALEWSIVAMAERDGMSSIREPGRLLSAFASLFGNSQPNRLANERLETLRRVAVFVWTYGWNVPKEEIVGFLQVGFSPDQFELLQHSVGEARRNRRRKTVR